MLEGLYGSGTWFGLTLSRMRHADSPRALVFIYFE